MQREPGAAPLARDARPAARELRRIGWDTWSGMFYSDATACFIILATAVTLHVAGVTSIETAAQAAGVASAVGEGSIVVSHVHTHIGAAGP